MTLNERMIEMVKEQMGIDSQYEFLVTMAEGNILSIPEAEMREHLKSAVTLIETLLKSSS